MDRVLIKKLPLLLPIMMALTSCSTMSNMNQQPHVSTPIHAKHAKPVKHAKQVVMHHHKHHASSVATHAVMPVEHAKVTHNPISEPVINQQQMSKAITLANPIVGDIWLFNIHGINMNAHQYKKVKASSLEMNLQRKDAMHGDYHYIQASRWDGAHVDQGYMNARTAALLSLIGLGMFDYGYVQTNFGATIMLFGGTGYVVDIPGHQYDLVHQAVSVKHPVDIKITKPVKKHFIKQSRAQFDSNDFFIQGTTSITFTSKNLHKHNKVAAQIHRVSKKPVYSSKHHKSPSQVAARKQLTHRTPSFNKQFCGFDNASMNVNAPGMVVHNLWESHVSTVTRGHQMAANDEAGTPANNYSTPVYTDAPA